MPGSEVGREAGLGRHRAALTELSAALQRLVAVEFPPFAWVCGQDRDDAERYVGGRRGVLLGSEEDLTPSAGEQLRDALAVARGRPFAADFVSRLARPLDSICAWALRAVAVTGSTAETQWEAYFAIARADARLADAVSHMELDYELARREINDAICYVRELLFSLTPSAIPQQPAGPTRARMIRILVDKGSFTTPTGNPRDGGRVRIRVEIPGELPQDARIARAQHGVLMSLEKLRRVDLGDRDSTRQLAERLLKKLLSLGIRARRPEGGRAGELEVIDELQLVPVSSLVALEWSLQRFEDESRRQEVRGQI